MRHLTLVSRALAVGALLLPAAARAQHARPQCDPDVKLPPGFCATLFADGLPAPRHIAVAANGDVFVSLAGTRTEHGGVVALRDTTGDGKADVRQAFGDFRSSEVRLFDGYLYTETTTDILRYRMRPGALEPVGGPDTVVKGLPPGGNHFFKTFVIDPKGVLYVNVGSATNACQSKDRQPGVPGADPCVELETRAGIWKFDARKLGQTQATGEHYARGIRNAVGMDIHPGDNVLWTTQHGRDQLNNWPQWNDSTSAESPGEELFRVTRGDDFGWPYCYYDMARQAKLLAPEYGGDGRTAGRCADKKGHVAVFPAHWAPNGLMFYRGTMFPARYREGAFIAFHGSWNRAPMPQQGFRVVFQPLRGNAAAGPYETFLSGFFEDGKPTTLGGRPTGLGQGPDGAIYVADDMKGRVWRITYTGTR